MYTNSAAARNFICTRDAGADKPPVDWQQRGDARARMRTMVKVLLQHRYSPDQAQDALERALKQAERLSSDDWVFK